MYRAVGGNAEAPFVHIMGDEVSPAMQCQTTLPSDLLNTTSSIHNTLFCFCIPLLTFALTEVIFFNFKHIYEELCGLKFRISPDSFFQGKQLQLIQCNFLIVFALINNKPPICGI